MSNAQAVSLNAELVINGGAETGDTTGWVSTGIDSVTPDSFAEGFGSFAFTGGKGETTETLTQTIDVSANSSQIDAEEIKSTFSINLQSRSNSGLLDTASAEVSFIGSSGEVLASFSFIDTINTESYDWNTFSDSRLLPKGTKSIKVLLTANRNFGSSSDGFFDNVSLQLHGIESCSTSTQGGTVSADLNIYMPILNYQSLTGTQNIWANFEFYGQSDTGELLWKLKDYGPNL